MSNTAAIKIGLEVAKEIAKLIYSAKQRASRAKLSQLTAPGVTSRCCDAPVAVTKRQRLCTACWEPCALSPVRDDRDQHHDRIAAALSLCLLCTLLTGCASPDWDAIWATERSPSSNPKSQIQNPKSP